MGNNKFSIASVGNRRAFRDGARDGVPIALGYFAVSFSLGIVARNVGMTPIQGMITSALCNASAGEYAAELFDYLTRRITTSYEKAARLKRQDENRPIRVVKKYVEEHFGEPLTLEELSQVVDLSPTYLSTIFKKDTGMTFLEYLSKVRMDMAKKLLKETNDTVADICGKVGYSDVRYFTKTFTKYAGLKPKEYRKLYS